MEIYDQENTGLTVSPKLKADLLKAANWAKIIVISSWISSIVSVIVNIATHVKLAFVSGIISIGLSVLIYVYLLSFGTQVKKGLTDDDREMLNKGLFSLRTYFKIVSLLLIIAMGIGFIFLLFFIFLAAKK
jgi:hypothetical protein